MIEAQRLPLEDNESDIEIIVNDENATGVLSIFTPTQNITVMLTDKERRLLIQDLTHVDDDEKNEREFIEHMKQVQEEIERSKIRYIVEGKAVPHKFNPETGEWEPVDDGV